MRGFMRFFGEVRDPFQLNCL